MKAKDLTQNEKVRSLLNRKVLLGASSILICVVLIAVCSFVPFIIDPHRWMTNEFLTDELIIGAIVIFSMVAAMFIGQAGNAFRDESNIAKARKEFFDTVKNVTNIFGFNQWIKKVLQPRDIQLIKERRLRSIGIDDYRVLELENSQIRALEEKACAYEINGEKRYFKGITKEQVQGILKIRNGKIDIRFVEPEYYLSVKNLVDNRTISERSSDEGKKKSFYLARSIVGRLLVTIITAMIFASFMRDLSTAADLGTAFQKFLSRLWAMISSVFMGYLVGCQINDIDAEYIQMRITVQNMYLQDKDFKPLTQQEEAKQEFKERVLQEEHALLDNKSTQIEMKG